MLALFKKAGMPLRAPPDGECGMEGGGEGAPHIVSPLRGVTHLQRLERREPMLLRADTDGAPGLLRWFAGDSFLGSSMPGEALPWQAPGAGHYLLRVVDAKGLADSRELLIETVR
ncbi:MAG TPA: hypothetical protein DCW29_06485 [Janthinobacterium sp.]|nr:hypothetical protein [Janthinobacterium sp.]